MQTKRIFPVLLFVLISSIAFSQNPVYSTTINNTKPPVSFHLAISAGKTPTSFNLWIGNPEKKKLHLQISHRSLGYVVDTVISSGQLSQRYNMTEADDGNYLVTVVSGNEKLEKEIELNTVTTRKVVIH